MVVAFFTSWLGWLRLGLQICRTLPAAGLRAIPRRLLILIPAWCLFGALNALHWLGFLIDEVLFRGYRKISVERPVHIVGVPRSGTTHLHRVVANDPMFTTFSLIECLLAPSVTEKYLWLGPARLLRKIWPGNNPAEGPGLIPGMASIHRIGLSDPEEDFVVLLWIHACFLTVLCAPADQKLWSLMAFDRDIPIRRKNLIMSFYEAMQKKHLYFAGPGHRMLSKNPTFTSMLDSLSDWFPDVTCVICVREPAKTVPSQLSSLGPALALLGHGKTIPSGFKKQIQSGLCHYYGAINHHMLLARHLQRPSMVIPMSRLKSDLLATVSDVLHLAEQPMSSQISDAIADHLEEPYQSGHRYDLADYDLTRDDIDRFFAAVWPLVISPEDDVPTNDVEHV